MKFFTRISTALLSPIGAIAILSFLAFGALTPWLGFYWDDWSLMWIAHKLGPESLQLLSTYHVRPLSGWVLWLGAEVLGENPFGWHIIIWLFRLTSGILIYWFGELLWPEGKRSFIFAALIFVLYPGYRHQLVSVNTTYHVAALVLFLLSLCLMVIAFKSESRKNLYLVFSVVLALSSLLTSEYIYGLELVRPLIIYYLLSKGESRSSQIKETFVKWSPFLLQIVGVYLWRFSLSGNLNYPVLIFDDLNNSTSSALVSYLNQALTGIYEVTVMSWTRALQWPNLREFGKLSFSFLSLAVFATFAYAFFLFRRHKQNEIRTHHSKEIFFLGLAGLFLAGIPFWVAGLDIAAVFPADRFLLPLTFGATLAIVGAMEIIFGRRKNVLILLYTLSVALAMGFHIQNAVNFYRDWKSFSSFNTQLHWRIPGVRENTALLSPELPIHFSTDDSLTAALNWGYDLPVDDGKMRLNLSYIDLRFLDQDKELNKPFSIRNNYVFFRFEGSSEEMLLLEFDPPACLRIYHPRYDYLNPQISPELRDLLSSSNMERIINSADTSIVLPKALLENPVEKRWCYYFQMADLARQHENWKEVVRIGDIAFSSEESPNHAAERFPFIEGYAITGNLARAKELSLEALKINPKTKEALCLIWDRNEERSDLSEKNTMVLKDIKSALTCK